MMSGLVRPVIAELAALSDRLNAWAQDRLVVLADLPDWAFTLQGAWWSLRLVLVCATVVAYLFARGRIAKLVSVVVQRLSNRPALRGHVGTIVRWAGFAQTLLPTLAAAAFAYVGLALIGLDYPEVELVEIVFRWAWLYWLGRQILRGLTLRISRWRPALVQVAPETVALLTLTYARLGLVLALGLMIDELSRTYLGLGDLTALVGAVLVLFVGAWAAWAAHAWRHPLAGYVLQSREPDRSIHRLAGWMARSRWGGTLSLPALGLLMWDVSARSVRSVLDRGGILAYVRSRTLMRLAHKQAREEDAVTADALPEAYLRAFPLYPSLDGEPALLVPKPELVQEIVGRYRRWESSKNNSSLVVVGEKGCGKTTLLQQVIADLAPAPALRHVVRSKILSEAALCAQLSLGFGLPRLDTVEELAPRLRDLGPALVALDEAHNTFLRTVDGQRGLEALVSLVNATSDSLFWVLGFNQFAWEFINSSRRKWGYFRQVLTMSGWTVAEIQELIYLRSESTEFELTFDEVLLDDERTAEDSFELIENADAYFRMLWEESGGNPRVAMDLWLASLRFAGRNRVRVGFFSRPQRKTVDELPDELAFALAALSQHENLNLDELAEVLNVRVGPAAFALQYLREAGIIESTLASAERYTISPRNYRLVQRFLRQKHLL